MPEKIPPKTMVESKYWWQSWQSTILHLKKLRYGAGLSDDSIAVAFPLKGIDMLQAQIIIFTAKAWGAPMVQCQSQINY